VTSTINDDPKYVSGLGIEMLNITKTTAKRLHVASLIFA
jgi:hypothetical protein